MMRLFKDKIIFIIIITSFLIPAFASNPFAQEKKERGYKGLINKEVLLAKLKEVHGKKKEFVEGYEINGDDIISIIKTEDVDIKISNSIIKGGLDFGKPTVPITDVKLPEGWTEEEKEEWREKLQKKIYPKFML